MTDDGEDEASAGSHRPDGGAEGDVPLDIVGHETGHSEPGSSDGDPGRGSENDGPGNENDGPGNENDGPGNENDGPGNENDGQTADGDRSSADDDGPAAGGDDPGTDDESAMLSKFDVPEGASGNAGDEVEPVELLVQLAEDGEIDPWDIDVVRVTDKFLARLDDADLRTGGRALFYASVLLRMKSDAMWTDDEPDEEWAAEPWEMAPDEEAGEAGGPVVDPFEELEREMDRRIERKRARGMPETLDELVRDLRERERETWWKESRSYDTSESPSGFSRGTQTLDYRTGDDVRMEDEPTADDVTGTAHDEHMEDIINDVYVELQRHYDQGRDEVLFAEVREAGGSTVNTFLGVLFLAHRGQVRLQQDDLFGDLWVQDPAAVPAEEAAPADD